MPVPNAGDHVEFSGRLRARHAGAEAARHRDPVVVARLVIGCIRQQHIQVAERHPELAIEDQVEARGMREAPLPPR